MASAATVSKKPTLFTPDMYFQYVFTLFLTAFPLYRNCYGSFVADSPNLAHCEYAQYC